MSHRLVPGVESVIKVPAAEIVCDGPCGRSWPFLPKAVQVQPACAWRQTPEHFIVTDRYHSGPEIVTLPDGRDACPDCLKIIWVKA